MNIFHLNQPENFLPMLIFLMKLVNIFRIALDDLYDFHVNIIPKRKICFTTFFDRSESNRILKMHTD